MRKKAKTDKTKKSFKEIMKEPKMKQATIMLAASSVFLVIAIVALNSLGFFHLLVGLTIPRGVVKTGVISEENQIKEIPDGEIRYKINRDIVFDNTYSRGSIMFENPEISEYDLEFAFYLPNDRENAVYESPRLSPGEYLLEDKLTNTMKVKKGNFTCVCVARAYDSAGNYCGENVCSVKLTIQEN